MESVVSYSINFLRVAQINPINHFIYSFLSKYVLLNAISSKTNYANCYPFIGNLNV